jgi:four helix bundle protein
MGDFRKLAVWQKAHAVTLAMYHETARWPNMSCLGLSRRRVVQRSPYPQTSRKGVARTAMRSSRATAGTSLGSASELSYYVTLAHELGYLNRPDVR